MSLQQQAISTVTARRLLRACASARLLAAFTVLLMAQAQSRQPLLLRDPSISRTQIAFSYAGEIWIAQRDGSNPRPLTSGGGHERKPLFSPDGSQIAFTGTYGGTSGVYVVPAGGGEPRRLTYHPADIGVVGWMPDGKRIVFSSQRIAFSSRVVQLFTVPVEGGYASQLPLVRASEASISPDTRHVAYVPGILPPFAWKRYRGGATRPIWIADLVDSHIELKIPRENSNDFNPMWVGDTIYFLSDRNGTVTLFAYDIKLRQVKEIVRNGGLDIKSASATSDAIVYEQFGSLHVLDLKSGTDRTLDIRPVGNSAQMRPHFKRLEPTQIRFADLSPTGALAVFGVRGELLTVPAKRGDVSNVTNTTDVVERDPAWSPDGKSIAYFSDESGEYALHVRDLSGLRKIRKFDLGEPPSFFYSPIWSPDSSKIAYTDKRLNYWYVDLETKTPVRVDTDLYLDPAYSLQLAWSPDGRWLVYTKQLRSHWHAVFVYSLEQRRSYQLTDGMSDALHVAFDKGGQYLYFTASTDMALRGSWLDMSSFQRPVTRRVYVILLQKATPSPQFSDGEAQVGAETSAKGARFDLGQEKTAKGTIHEDHIVRIDFEGIMQRTLALPIPARNYYDLVVGKPGTVFLVEGPAVAPAAFHLDIPTNVHEFDLSTGDTVQILDGVTSFFYSFNGPDTSSFHVSSDGTMMLYAKQNKWFIAPTDRPGRGSPQTGQLSQLNVDAMEVYIDPRAEWKHLFDQVWRDMRDFFYDPGLHGIDLAAIKKKYEPYLQNISTRDDLNYLFEEMLGNVTVSHMAVGEGDVSEGADRKVGLLGADYSVENGLYRFARIYPGDTWSPDSDLNPELLTRLGASRATVAPLTTPTVNVQVGSYLLAVNGREVRPPADIYSFFEDTAGKQVILKVGPKPDGSGSRDVTVVPIEDETSLRNFAWIENNRRKVDELSGGRVAYVYVPNTGSEGYRSFNRYYFAQVGKEAAIIDERYNGGGKMADYMIEVLRRPLLAYWNMREGQDITTPIEAIFGPKVMIINEIAGSGGDFLPWAFRKAQIGPLIGKRTWGGLVGVQSLPEDLLDNSELLTPNLAFYSPDGTWDIENHGVPPDIEVEEDPKADREGHDPQLEKAIEVIMGLLKTNPPPSAPHLPPYPNYQQSGRH